MEKGITGDASRLRLCGCLPEREKHEGDGEREKGRIRREGGRGTAAWSLLSMPRHGCWLFPIVLSLHEKKKGGKTEREMGGGGGTMERERGRERRLERREEGGGKEGRLERGRGGRGATGEGEGRLPDKRVAFVGKKWRGEGVLVTEFFRRREGKNGNKF